MRLLSRKNNIDQANLLEALWRRLRWPLCGSHDGALASAVLCAFDLLELDGQDLRREPIEDRKRLLGKLLRSSQLSIVLNEHFTEDGMIVFRDACRLGCEGIVSKRVGSPYRSGRLEHWREIKNPAAPAVKREAEED